MHRFALAATFCATALAPFLLAQTPPGPLTLAEAQKTIETRTHIGQCADSDPTVFTDVKTAPAVEYKRSFGSQETHWLFPVKASYTVHCTQGNRNMKHGEVQEWQIEVQGNFRLYRDPFGDLQVANNFDDDWDWNDQYWNDAHADVHCRSRRLAFNTYDPATGKLLKRREDTGTAYGDCNVRINKDR